MLIGSLLCQIASVVSNPWWSPSVCGGHYFQEQTESMIFSKTSSVWAGVQWPWDFPGVGSGKKPACQCRRHKRHFQFLGQEDPLVEGMVIHSILAWRIPWTEESGALESTVSRRVRHDWSGVAHIHAHPQRLTRTHTHTHTHTLFRNISCDYPKWDPRRGLRIQVGWWSCWATWVKILSRSRNVGSIVCWVHHSKVEVIITMALQGKPVTKRLRFSLLSHRIFPPPHILLSRQFPSARVH